MALRVLLADESSTIKKVFQLALQDFAVDVRPVNVGIDVLSVAQKFKPDIIFADVLLQKKSGYEVAAELKSNAELNGIPVVLMWSGFMELDEDKFQASHANAQLEKPFDVTALRKLVTDLVPKTQNQNLSQFLSFPKLPDIQESPQPESAAPDLSLADEEVFKQVSIPKMKGGQQSGADKYRLNLSADDLDPNHIPVQFDNGAKAPVLASLGETDDEKDEFSIRDTRKLESSVASVSAPAPASAPATPHPEMFSLSEEQLEKIIRQQSAEVIEAVVWKIVPELATQIIERELNRLLKERDAHPF